MSSTHQPIGCPNHCHCSVHVCCTTTHFTTKFPFVCSCYRPLPHYLALWHASDGLNHLLLLLGKIPSQQGIFPKRSHGWKPWATSLILVGYKLVVLQPFCACLTIFCFCLLSFPRHFCHSRLVLFCSTGCFCLISSRISCCVCHFFRFGFSFLHVIPVTDTSCYSLFLFIVPFILVFTPIFYTKGFKPLKAK